MLEQKGMLDAAHWTPYERSEEVAGYIRERLGRKYKS